MENKKDTENIASKNIAHLTGEAYQDNETFKSEGGFEPERDQLYFRMRQGENEFSVGLKDLLICLKLAESLGEIPQIANTWWGDAASLYGGEIPMIDFKEYEV